MSESSVPFRHPWPERMFGEVGSVTVGGTPSTSVPEYWGGAIPWMASGDVHGRVIDDVPTRISGLGLRHSSAMMVDPPSVAVALAGQGRTRGTAAYVRCALCTNQSVALLKGNPGELDTGYLLYNLSFRYSELRSRSAGGGRAGLTKTILEQLPLPLPAAVPEQSKIAEVLSTVDRAIEQTEALTAKQQRIKTGLTQDLLTRGIDEHGNIRSEKTHKFKDSPLGRIPVEWDPMPFGSCGQWFSGGTPSKTIRRFWGGGVPWVCPKDMKQFELHQSIDTITGDAVAAGARLMPTGTVFIVIRGMILAHTFPVGVSTTEVAFNQDVKAIVPKQGLMGRYLAYWLSSHSHQFLKLATTATHGTKRFDMDELQAALVGVPLPNEQKHIVRIFDEQQSVIERLQGLTAKLQAEKRGLMKDLLTGDRRVTALLGSPEQVVGA